MLYSKNLISKPGSDSYNTQVRNINIMQGKEANELKALYEAQNERYVELNEVKSSVSESIAKLQNAMDCLDAMILLFKSAAKV